MHCIVMIKTRPMRISIRPPEMEIYPPKTACGCPCGGVTKNKANKNKNNDT